MQQAGCDFFEVSLREDLVPAWNKAVNHVSRHHVLNTGRYRGRDLQRPEVSTHYGFHVLELHRKVISAVWAASAQKKYQRRSQGVLLLRSDVTDIICQSQLEKTAFLEILVVQFLAKEKLEAGAFLQKKL